MPKISYLYHFCQLSHLGTVDDVPLERAEALLVRVGDGVGGRVDVAPVQGGIEADTRWRADMP